MPNETSTLGNRIEFVLTRVVVPLWVLLGAAFKLYERNPQNLPIVLHELLWRNARIDLTILLRVLIGLELFSVAVMLFVPRLSRAMAIFMLSVFCAVLIGEMIMKAQSCGCFGSLPVKPWHMLVIDGSLLAGVIFAIARDRAQRGPMPQRQSTSLLKPALAMIPLLVLGLIVGFAVPEPPPKSQTEPIATSNGSSAPDEPTPPTPPIPIDPQVNPNPRPVPNSWYTRNTGHQQDWIGKSWREIDLFQFLHRWPKDLDAGKHYVVFYSRTCEHCEAMFRDHFSHPLDAPVSAVEIPSSRTVLTGPGAWEMPPNICELLQLPLGCNWIITPPLALTIVDGKITCAIESEGFEQCLGLQ